ncbi:hypothetical protein EJ02DRAFT_252083 [Clathrospora elynae]|uniref:Uncharacterized protein n=1 Tax=Clathrospora elynae TaxID=706981 RepID=A0A6A5SHX6_9PLEO|nr:hypothetical protein EJ02DRAFT_252083 [Clathrospora elynae]
MSSKARRPAYHKTSLALRRGPQMRLCCRCSVGSTDGRRLQHDAKNERARPYLRRRQPFAHPHLEQDTIFAHHAATPPAQTRSAITQRNHYPAGNGVKSRAVPFPARFHRQQLPRKKSSEFRIKAPPPPPWRALLRTWATTWCPTRPRPSTPVMWTRAFWTAIWPAAV